MNMKKLIVSIFLFVCALHLCAQFKPMADVERFNSELAAEAQNLRSIESDFVQQKYLDVFDEMILSEGKFFYKSENKIRMEYSKPLDYLIVINGAKLKIVSDRKKNVMNLSANKMMNQMQDMLTACMVGDLSRLTADYELAYYEDSKYYEVRIKPVNKTIRSYIVEIVIHIDKENMSVDKLRLSETETNYTEYLFRNKRFNSLTDESIFEVR